MPLFGPNVKKMKEKGDTQGLIRELMNKNPEVRVEAVKALSELKYVEGLREAIRNDDSQVGVEAIGALAVLKCIDELLEALKNRNAQVRVTAIEVLKSFRDPKSAQPLFEILTNDAEDTVRQKAFEALSSFGVKEDGEIAEVWASVGVKLLEKGDYQVALNCFEEAARIEPEDKEMIGSIGAALSDHGRHQDALKYAKKLTQMDPQDARGYGLKGVCMFNLGEEDDALSSCRKALEIDARLKGARDILGAIYYKKEDYEALAAHSQETLRLTPEDIKARLMLSEALALSNKLVNAEAEAQKALEAAYQADYTDAESLSMIYQQLGILCVMRGHEGALEYFENAIKGNQRDEWMYKIADAYLMLNVTGSLMEGAPQERRARLLGLAAKRGRTYGSYLQWKLENEL